MTFQDRKLKELRELYPHRDITCSTDHYRDGRYIACLFYDRGTSQIIEDWTNDNGKGWEKTQIHNSINKG